MKNQAGNLKVLHFAIVISFLLTGNWALGQYKVLPVDPNVRIGRLNNGLTYYIRKNVNPEKRVELRLAVNVGSVQEDEDQLGLAHFVEHMCFNGTKNFPKNDLYNYLQSIGANFGSDYNGYTTFDETVYMLTLPVDSAKVLSNGLQIMEDWAHDVTFDATEIDKERGVVVEEWRLGRDATKRMLDKYMPVIFKDSKYAKRFVIGTKEIIEGAKYQTIRRFYRDWYRPDLMAFIVVGDIDPDRIEKKIKADFEDFKSPATIRKKEIYPVPDNDKPLISIVSDKENVQNSIAVIYKTEPEIFRTTNDYRQLLTYRLFTAMMSQRFDELRQKENPPFINVFSFYGRGWARTKTAYQQYVNVSENGIEKGLQTVLEENERVKKFGFTANELDRYKKIMLNNINQAYHEKEKTESKKYAQEYISNFLVEEPIPGIEFEYNFTNEVLPDISLIEVNKLAAKWMTEKNQIVVIQGIDKTGITLPTEAAIQNIMKSVDVLKIEPYKETVVLGELMATKPVKGTITAEKQFSEYGITEFTLSNGAKVVLKPTTFKNDEILMTATSLGGVSQFPDDYIMSALFASGIIAESGLGNFSNTALMKLLAGKNAAVSTSVGTNNQVCSGKSSVADLETMMQLTYLSFTQPRRDETAFQSFLTRTKETYKNYASDPANYFFDKEAHIKYGNHPRVIVLPNDADFNKVNPDRVMEIQKTCFKNAKGFTFVFVGSFKTETIKPLIETYIASLPSDNSKAKCKDNNMRLIKGPYEEKVLKGNEPRSYVSVSFGMPAEYSREESHSVWTFKNILEKILLDKLREEMGGVYGFRVIMDLEKYPNPIFNFNLLLPCKPENVNTLLNTAMEEIKKIQTEGVKSEDIAKEQESQRRTIENQKTENGSWLNNIRRVYENTEPYEVACNQEVLIKLVNSENIKRIAKKYLDTKAMIKIALYPEN